MTRTISLEQRRRSVARRHHLGGDATTPEAATRSVLALHATDPASVYVSVLARSHASTIADVAAAMYERRTLVRWMSMRRTLFVYERDDVPMIQAAVSTPLAATLRRQLISRLARSGTVPPIEGDIAAWLMGVEARVEQALATRGSATGAQLSTDVPALRTAITPRAPSDLPQNVTSMLLTIMSAEGRMVRGIPAGAWTTRHHRWQPLAAWWPDGLPAMGLEHAQRELVRRWLERFGPATVDDVEWWTGWTKIAVRSALSALPIEEVDLHGTPGIAIGEIEDAPAGPGAALLPSLDPTAMGWKRRDWYFDVEPTQVTDRYGNIGPTLWWDGRIVGSWAVAPSGELRTAIVADVGADARAVIAVAAARLESRLEGAVITPAFRTPLERSLLT